MINIIFPTFKESTFIYEFLLFHQRHTCNINRIYNRCLVDGNPIQEPPQLPRMGGLCCLFARGGHTFSCQWEIKKKQSF